MAVDALAGRVTAGDRARGWAVTVRLRSADARARWRPHDEADRVDAAWPQCPAPRPGEVEVLTGAALVG